MNQDNIYSILRSAPCFNDTNNDGFFVSTKVITVNDHPYDINFIKYSPELMNCLHKKIIANLPPDTVNLTILYQTTPWAHDICKYPTTKNWTQEEFINNDTSITMVFTYQDKNLNINRKDETDIMFQDDDSNLAISL